VAPSSVLSVYYDKMCLKFVSHHFLLYAVYICQNHWILSTHSNASRKNVSWPHLSWPTLYICVPACRLRHVYSSPGIYQVRLHYADSASTLATSVVAMDEPLTDVNIIGPTLVAFVRSVSIMLQFQMVASTVHTAHEIYHTLGAICIHDLLTYISCRTVLGPTCHALVLC